MNLIDKAALVAEIEKLKADTLQKKSQCKRSGLERIMHQIGAYNKVISLINTPEVKEVDLKKEFNKYFFNFIDPKTGEKLKKEECWLDIKQARKFAKHFFELGLKAQKGK